jgi:hypothetical protein
MTSALIKREVGGPSPPKSTIKITNKYAAIHTFSTLRETFTKGILGKELPKLRVREGANNPGRSSPKYARVRLRRLEQSAFLRIDT